MLKLCRRSRPAGNAMLQSYGPPQPTPEKVPSRRKSLSTVSLLSRQEEGPCRGSKEEFLKIDGTKRECL